MDLLLTIGAGIAALFLVSVVIVFLSSWILGRSRGCPGKSGAAHHHYEELDELPVRRSTYEPEETVTSTTDNSLISEIMSVDLPEEFPMGTQAPLRAEEEKPSNPLVSFIEGFDFSDAGDGSSETTGIEPEDEALRELVGGDDGVSLSPEVPERESYKSYPGCFGNNFKNCSRNCGFAEECRRTAEILGEFI
ncbi:hypothetical protein [Candidatus Pyrohabitans sp.]